ncbi:MAG: hypothetical protein ABS69_03850 [Nitrosomonadales bacterium SCN 54-20]|nr:MAG: hypothetical protein ABS69_03850 [Nitrosomonadales bacterium SCN 54-20]
MLSAARGRCQDDLIDGPYRNIVYFMSATSGIGAAFEYDRSYVRQSLEQTGGAFYGFTDAEAEITEELRELSIRKYEVGFFASDGKVSGAGRLMGVNPLNPSLLKAAFPPPVQELKYQQNQHKQNELATFYDALGYLAEQTRPHAGMVFAQNTRFIQMSLEASITVGTLGVRKPDEHYDQIYEIDPEILDMATEEKQPIVVVVFDARFLKKLRPGSSGFMSGKQLILAPLGTNEEESPDQEDTEVRPDDLDGLQKALLPYSNLDKNKLLFVSRYISAARGLSLSAYCGSPRRVRDYDFIVLANHRFYDSFLRRRDDRMASPESMMAALKQLRDAGELGLITLSEFGQQLYQNRYELLSQPRLLENFANILQTAGRLDRGNDLPHVQRLFATADYVPDLVEGAQVTDFPHRAAKLPQALILGAEDHYNQQCPAIADFDAYLLSETILALAFLELIQRFTHDLVANPDSVVRRRVSYAWANLRRIEALTDPSSYKAVIETMDWPYEESTRQIYLAYIYFNPAPYGGNPALLKERTLSDCMVGDERVRILTDPAHALRPAGRNYRPIDQVVSRNLLSRVGRNDYTRLAAGLGLDEPDKLFVQGFPRPHFLINFVKGFVGEFLVDRALREVGVECYPDEWAIEQDIFERFDLYGRLPSGRLFAIDCKHWTRSTARHRGNILKTQALEKAHYVSKRLGESVLFLYINVLGGAVETPYHEAGFDIEFLSLCNDNKYLKGQLSARFRQLFHINR